MFDEEFDSMDDTPLLPAFTVYSKTGCPYCVKAKELLNNKYKGRWTEIMCDDRLVEPADKAAFLEEMEVKCKRAYKTFPMIFKEDVFVGGYTDLAKLLG